ncbi:MAG: twin-arginine translocase TatA/TatE family subunit [Solirubrobacteraceae bacterium]
MIGNILSPAHILLILAVALLVLGPKRLPEVGRGLGSAIRDFKGSLSGLTEERPAVERTNEIDVVQPSPTSHKAGSRPNHPVVRERGGYRTRGDGSTWSERRSTRYRDVPEVGVGPPHARGAGPPSPVRAKPDQTGEPHRRVIETAEHDDEAARHNDEHHSGEQQHRQAQQNRCINKDDEHVC